MSELGEPARVHEGLWRRSAALWRVEPLVALERSKDHRQGDWSPFDLIALQAAALEAVMAEMGLTRGARLDDVRTHVAELAAVTAPDWASPRATEVADAVLANLRNTGDQGRRFRRHPTDFLRGTRTPLDFAFVHTDEDDEGSFLLRASDEAINLLLGALDHDLEQEQQALLLVLDRQLEAGKFDQALSTATKARERTKQYVERVRSRIDDMRRDMTGVAWFGDLDVLLEEASAHVREQLSSNGAVRERVEDLLDRANEPRVRGQLGRVRTTVVDTVDRNSELRRWLARVGEEFRTEQRRQVFVQRRTTTLCRLQEDLFAPLLSQPVKSAADIVGDFAVAVSGPHRRRLFDLSQAVRRLLEPVREPTTDVVPAHERDLERVVSDPVRFDAGTVRAVAAVLGAVDASGVRLSCLLRGASDDDCAALLWAEAIARFAPEREFDEGGTTVVAFDDGARFDDGRFGGADLLLRRVPTPERFTADADGLGDLPAAGEPGTVAGAAGSGQEDVG